MAIEVFAELGCPFTHLALRRILARRDDLGQTTPLLRVRPWPLEVVNGQPMSARHVAEEVDALRRQISPDLFTGFDAAAFPSTSMPAFRLVEVAYDVDAALGERLSCALRDAVFEEGRDVADPSVLADIAARHGLEVPDEALDERVRAAHAEGERRGVEGSPQFFVAGGSQFCPLIDIRRDDDGRYRLSVDEAAANAVIDGWLSPV